MYHRKQESQSQWIFPKQIDFETASNYFNKMGRFDYSGELTFDLSNTEEVHSAFIGFLMDLKQRYDNHGGSFTLKLSSSLEHLLRQIELRDFFVPNFSREITLSAESRCQ